MTRIRLALLAFLVGTLLGACGGRSTLKTYGYDGGDEADGGAKLDSKRDSALDADGAKPSDASADLARDTLLPADVVTADVATRDLPADSLRTDALADGRPAQDAVDANRADSIGDAIRIGDAGRDATDATRDGPAALTGIEIAPANPTIAAGVPYTSLVVTALFSDGTSSDVTASATFTSSDTAIILVSGRSLTGQKAGSATITATYSGRTTTTRITVSSATLTSISIDGITVVSVGQSILATATGLFADGTKQDITAAATWTSSNISLATVAPDSASAKEKVTGVKAGNATISATYQGITSTAALTVTASAITAIGITPVQPILQRGTSKEFQATATYADGTTSDVTSQATWTLSDATVASVATGTGVVVRALAAGTATLTATVGTIRGSTTVTVTTPTLVSIALTPATWSPNVGARQAFTATGTYSDASTADLTISATWSSTAATVVSISNAAGQKGQATALAVGTAQVQAALSGVIGSAAVTVSASPLVSIAVTPSPVAIVLGLTSPLVATATYQNGTTQVVTTQVAWSVADSAIASVSNATTTAGQVKGLATGSTTVTATLAGMSGSTKVSVTEATLTTITVAPATATVTAGTSQAFTATGNYSGGATADLTTQVTWSSSDITVAQASNASGSKGLTTALVAGRATISATLGAVSGTAALIVSAPQLASVTLSPTSASVGVGENQAFTATAVYENGTTGRVQGATWTSSNPAVATMSTQGQGNTATGVAAGTTTITVTFQGKSASATLTVTAAVTLLEIIVTPQSPASILVGATQPFQATAIYSDGSTGNVTNAVSWTTSNANVASISNGGGGPGGGPGGGGNAGMATGVGAGTATITASYDGTCATSCTATSTLTVRDPTATGLTITPVSASVRVGGTQQFTAVLVYDDGTSRTQTTGVSWTTSDGTIASISSGGGGGPGGGGGNAGLATGIGAGTAKITATYGSFTAAAALTVTAATATALVVTPATASIVVNSTQAMVATLVYNDGTTSVVTASADWTSSDAAIATVTTGTPGGGPGGGGPGGGGGGNVSALAVGKATITATYSGLSGTATLTVTDPPLSFIQVTPTNQNLPVGATQQFTATAIFADFSTRNVTTQTTWASSNTTVAVVTGTGANAGRASALAEGTATITATYDGVSGTTVLTVAKSVKSLSIAPANPTTVLGLGVSFSATATLSNNATLVVTQNAAWVSSDAGVATVTSGGIATPVKAGTATITATYLGVSGTSTLTVSAATLSSINVTPSPLSLARGGSQQLTATGLYSDSTSHDLTAVATWLSATATVASVSNASGSRGLLTALASGSTNVTAVFQGVTSAADAVTVTVGP